MLAMIAISILLGSGFETSEQTGFAYLRLGLWC